MKVNNSLSTKYRKMVTIYVPVILIICYSFSGCTTTTPSPIIKTIITLVDDFSSTRLGSQKLDVPFIGRIAEFLRTLNRDIIFMATHVSQPHPNPVSCSLTPFTESIDQFDLSYKRKLQQREANDSLNIQAIETFKERFEASFTRFNLTKETDFSYITRHLKSITHTLGNATATTHRIAVISTDFMNHEKGGTPSLPDAHTIQQLNYVLSTNEYAHFYVITDISVTGTVLEDLQAQFLGSWTEFESMLHNHFSNFKTETNVSYRSH